MITRSAVWRSRSETLMPWARSLRARSASASSSVVIMPPSPVVMTLRGWKLNTVWWAFEPVRRPLYSPPTDGAASSTTSMPCSVAIALIASISAVIPIWSTGMIAFVRLVMRCAMSAGSMLYVRASMSANTTVAPVYRIAFAEAMNVNDGTMTSSPGPTPAVASARWRPVVQEVVAIPCFAPTYDATAFSNSATFGPWVTHPLLIDSYGARASSSPSDGFVIGTLSFFFASVAIRQDLFPPFDEPAHAVFERRGRFETEQVASPPRIAHPPRGKRALRLGRELHPDGATGEPEDERGELTHRRLDPAADVHDSRRDRGLAREQVRP